MSEASVAHYSGLLCDVIQQCSTGGVVRKSSTPHTLLFRNTADYKGSSYEDHRITESGGHWTNAYLDFDVNFF